MQQQVFVIEQLLNKVNLLVTCCTEQSLCKTSSLSISPCVDIGSSVYEQFDGFKVLLPGGDYQSRLAAKVGAVNIGAVFQQEFNALVVTVCDGSNEWMRNGVVRFHSASFL